MNLDFGNQGLTQVSGSRIGRRARFGAARRVLPLALVFWPGLVPAPAALAEAGYTSTSAAALASAPRDPSLSEDNARAAVAALGASLDVERDLLKRQQDLYRETAEERDSAASKLQQLLNDLDGIVQGAGSGLSDAVEGKYKEIAETESRRLGAIQRCRELIDRIDEIQQRASGLEKKIAALREALPKTRENMTGSWRITYLPGLSKGLFVLKQMGTIIQGQYQLDGGWRGSLQGTFIDGKVYLQRIDSKLGRSSELEGFLSSDGASIRGTWRNYNLTDGGVAAGSWTASRQQDD